MAKFLIIFIVIMLAFGAVYYGTGRQKPAVENQSVNENWSWLWNYSGDKEFGLSGYSSTSLQSSEKVYTMIAIPEGLQDIKRMDFPCELGKEVVGFKANIRLYIDDGTGRVDKKAPADIYDLGEREFYQETEQYDKFAALLPASLDPTVDIVGLARRKSCYEAELEVFGVDSSTNKIVKYQFVNKNGQAKDYVILPKGVYIPQRDEAGNIIEDKYDPKTGKRIKVRYKFDTRLRRFIEIESWIQ